MPNSRSMRLLILEEPSPLLIFGPVMGFYRRTRGRRCNNRETGMSTKYIFTSSPTILWWSIFSSMFFVWPLQLKRPSLPSKHTPSVGQAAVFWGFLKNVPPRIPGVDCVCVLVCAVCCVYISNPSRSDWRSCERFLPRSCPFICYGGGLKHVGEAHGGDWFSYHKHGMDISIMSLFVIHDYTTL